MEEIDIQLITNLQERLTKVWHSEGPRVRGKGVMGYVEGNHLQNFLLWHEEDKARRDDMGYEFVYNAKRNIDKFNQERNNCMELIDRYMVTLLGDMPSDGPMHTETPGMIIDRLSILCLKAYHMKEEAFRIDASTEHRERCGQKFLIICQQRTDLVNNFQDLIGQFVRKEKGFRVYYQFKMYNDAMTNPELYKQKG